MNHVSHTKKKAQCVPQDLQEASESNGIPFQRPPSLGVKSVEALWCMLGYLLGLGDRHCENILIDTESGRPRSDPSRGGDLQQHPMSHFLSSWTLATFWEDQVGGNRSKSESKASLLALSC